jgi:hypothetical protein
MVVVEDFIVTSSSLHRCAARVSRRDPAPNNALTDALPSRSLLGIVRKWHRTRQRRLIGSRLSSRRYVTMRGTSRLRDQRRLGVHSRHRAMWRRSVERRLPSRNFASPMSTVGSRGNGRGAPPCGQEVVRPAAHRVTRGPGNRTHRRAYSIRHERAPHPQGDGLGRGTSTAAIAAAGKTTSRSPACASSWTCLWASNRVE